MKRLLAAGYFGCGNLGDDAILFAFREGTRALGHDLRAMSGSPEVTYRQLGIPCVPRKDMNAVRAAIEECDALVFPGGSVFQDTTSVRSVVYYGHLFRMAKKAGKKVFLVGQGIGPVNTFFGKRIVRGVFSGADLVAVRDPESAKLLHSLGVTKPPTVTADTALMLSEPNASEDGAFSVGGMKAIGLAPRPHGKGKGDGTGQVFGELARLLSKQNMVPMLIEMDSVMDKVLIDKLEKEQGGRIPGIRKIQHPVDLQRRLARLEAVVAMRLHAGILAATVGVPCLMITYDPKVTAFANQVGFPTLSPNELRPERVLEALTQLLKQRDQAAQNLRSRVAPLREQALKNLTLVNEALSR